ncbi:MAG: hypothetical protein HQK99_05070 [Nitrospirae bacterium]|nr:hypothetical protein [Nitrospirota bacterium]
MKKALLVSVVVLMLSLCYTQSYAAVTLSSTSGAMFSTFSGQYYLTNDNMMINGTRYWLQWKYNQNTYSWDLVAGGQSPSTATGSLYGTYFYDATAQILVLKLTYGTPSVMGLQCGPSLGKMVYYVTNVSATSASIREIGSASNGTSTITRTSGTAGDVTGTWTATSNNGSVMMQLNSDGSAVAYSNFTSCPQ